MDGQGIGRRLFQQAASLGRQWGTTRLEWQAETNAIGFYEKMGGRDARDGEPSVWGRVNPVMALELT